MRNPHRWRGVGLAAAVTGVVAAIAASALPDQTPDAFRTALLLYGIMRVLFGGMGAPVAHGSARAKEALASGPKCGSAMITRRWARRFGKILAGCGLFITALMGMVTYYTAPLMLRPGTSIDGTRFSGTAGEAWFILGIFGVVLAF